MSQPPHAQTPQETASTLGSNLEVGLSEQEAATRLNKYGKNTLTQEREIRFLGILKEEITEPMILLLLAIGVIYSALGILTGDGLTDAAAIIVIIILLVLAEVWNEYRAKGSISALRKLAPPNSNGTPQWATSQCRNSHACTRRRPATKSRRTRASRRSYSRSLRT